MYGFGYQQRVSIRARLTALENLKRGLKPIRSRASLTYDAADARKTLHQLSHFIHSRVMDTYRREIRDRELCEIINLRLNVRLSVLGGWYFCRTDENIVLI